MIIKTEEIRNNFYHGAIYKNRPDETCYEHAIDSEIRSCLEIFIRKYQKTETTISFYGHDFSKTSDSVDSVRLYLAGWYICERLLSRL